MNQQLNLLEIKIKPKNGSHHDGFLIIKESLTRIGFFSKKDNVLYQSCHILHKGGKYYIVHFKEMFLLDGKDSTLDCGDITRRNKIATLLENWNLLEIVDSNNRIDNSDTLTNNIFILSKNDPDYDTIRLVSKYRIGKLNRDE